MLRELKYKKSGTRIGGQRRREHYGGCAIGDRAGNYKLKILRELKSARGVVGVSEETGWTTIALVLAPKSGEGGGRFTAEGGVGIGEGPGGQAAL